MTDSDGTRCQRRVVWSGGSALVRPLLVGELERAGLDVVAQVVGSDNTLRAVRVLEPDVLILERSCLTEPCADAVTLAVQLRTQGHDAGLLVMSDALIPACAKRLFDFCDRNVGYLVVNLLTGVEELLNAIERVATGGVVVPPEVETALVRFSRRNHRAGQDVASPSGPLERVLSGLTPTRRLLLARIIEGLSNEEIAADLGMSERTVESHVSGLFRCLALPDERRPW